MKKQMDMEVIRDLEKLPLEEARTLAKSQLKMKRNSRYIKLIHDLDQAKTSREVQRIVWFALLAGEGLAVTGSKWQQEHNFHR